ncbi:hypothetical protein [Anaerococcus prevotii]|uniref:Uncharacterized protein n=1 Tax=Anaerococcus prevotii ACS-065-V-Col13 TaxID=879305 RepID=F0GUR1_9FIRM|nr:hypothetical protein [Anaerococcus prevotii]EGC82662.1 hypothetical protein HMPREF9290_1483 [Anaerococcus prevotii ACS-065-V-Col13]
MRKTKVSMVFFIIGVLLLAVSFFVPTDILNSYTNLKPIGLSTLFVCPVFGILGVLFSIKEKSLIFGLLNALLMLAFPIMMFVGYNIL